MTDQHRGAFGEYGGESAGFIDRAFRERIVLAAVTIPPASEEDTELGLDELERLVDTAGADVVDRVVQRRSAPDPATYIGTGKAEELREVAEAAEDLLAHGAAGAVAGVQQAGIEFERPGLAFDHGDESRMRLAPVRLLARAGLEGKEGTHPYHLSLSERKRVALASVLAMETPIVVLDEPTTGQDARGVALIGRVVGEIAAEGRTVVAITHDMDFCAENFDRVLVMAGGRVIADGTAEQAFAQLDALAEAHVEPPQLERLRTALGWPAPVSTVDEFVAQLKSRRGPCWCAAPGC